jgi:hypothetical protein
MKLLQFLLGLECRHGPVEKRGLPNISRTRRPNGRCVFRCNQSIGISIPYSLFQLPQFQREVLETPPAKSSPATTSPTILSPVSAGSSSPIPTESSAARTEDDESYRYRIHLRLTAQSGINEAALRYQMLQLPGIQDVVFETSAGSFSVYLYAVSPVVPPSLLQLAGTLLTDTVAFPIQANVLTPGPGGHQSGYDPEFHSRHHACRPGGGDLERLGGRSGLHRQPSDRRSARHQPAGCKLQILSLLSKPQFLVLDYVRARIHGAQNPLRVNGGSTISIRFDSLLAFWSRLSGEKPILWRPSGT